SLHVCMARVALAAFCACHNTPLITVVAVNGNQLPCCSKKIMSFSHEIGEPLWLIKNWNTKGRGGYRQLHLECFFLFFIIVFAFGILLFGRLLVGVVHSFFVYGKPGVSVRMVWTVNHLCNPVIACFA